MDHQSEKAGLEIKILKTQIRGGCVAVQEVLWVLMSLSPAMIAFLAAVSSDVGEIVPRF